MNQDFEGAGLLRRILTEALDAGASSASITSGTPPSVSFRIRGKNVPRPESGDLPVKALLLGIKKAAKLDPSDPDLPQDGWFEEAYRGAKWTVVVTCIPYVSGETAVLTFYPPVPEGEGVSLPSLGVAAETIHALESFVEERRGLLVVAGLSSDVVTGVDALCRLDPLRRGRTALLSLSGRVGPAHVTRRGSDPNSGVSYSRRFRDTLGRGFNAVILSEVADMETAEALFEKKRPDTFLATGLHVRRASVAPARLLDMGVPEERLAELLRGVLGLRLAQRVCRSCRTSRPPTPVECAAIERYRPSPDRVWDAQGCEACENEGTEGRVALAEWMEVTGDLRDRLAEPEEQLAAAAFPERRGSMVLDGLRHVEEGAISVREWMAVSHALE